MSKWLAGKADDAFEVTCQGRQELADWVKGVSLRDKARLRPENGLTSVMWSTLDMFPNKHS